MTGARPTDVLQPYVEAVRQDTGTSTITVLAPDRTRYTHPNPAQIGQPFLGTIASALRDRLVAYAEYRDRLSGHGDAAGQEDVDRALEGPRPQRQAALPKGLHRQTLDSVVVALRSADGLSAAEAAAELGTSRITARRYLEYLEETGLASRTPRYGGVGRPQTEYRWR